jgi:hypothetical protein
MSLFLCLGSFVKRVILRLNRSIGARNWLPFAKSRWKCDRCGKTGWGNVSNFFGLEEIEHYLTVRCGGSLKPAVRVSGWRLSRRLTTLIRSSTYLNNTQSVCVLGFGSTRVISCGSAHINAQPWVSFRPERLIIPDNIALNFLITDIKIGKNSQLLTYGAVPAVVFNKYSSPKLKMDTAQVLTFVTLTVTNVSKTACNFQAALIGPPLDEKPAASEPAIIDEELHSSAN